MNDLEMSPRSLTIVSRESCRVAMHGIDVKMFFNVFY